MKLLNLRIINTAAILPPATTALAVAIFAADTITDLEIAFPVFYTAVVLLAVRSSKKRGVIFAGAGCCGLTLLSDLLTLNTGVTEIGIINTAISLLAITATTYLALVIEKEKTATYEARTQLAHVTRVTTLGELTATIAHEVNQPLAAAANNGNACLRWLAAQPPNLGEARLSVERFVQNANRASEIITRVRALTKSSPPGKDWLRINEAILATIMLIEVEIDNQNRVTLQKELSDDVPLVRCDPVQLQQVILNLLLNAIEAMNLIAEGPRRIIIRSTKNDSKAVLISIEDTGAGFAPEDIDRLFGAFYTTKPHGMGMGLAISRSIIETHGGRIWATPNVPRGAVFQFTLPVGEYGAA